MQIKETRSQAELIVKLKDKCRQYETRIKNLENILDLMKMEQQEQVEIQAKEVNIPVT
jgi:hypothetical protein